MKVARSCSGGLAIVTVGPEPINKCALLFHALLRVLYMLARLDQLCLERRHFPDLSARLSGKEGLAYPKAIATVPIRTTMPNAKATPHRNWRTVGLKCVTLQVEAFVICRAFLGEHVAR